MTGVNTPGKAIEARTASTSEPSRSHNSLPPCSAVATAPNGIGRSSIRQSSKCLRKKLTSFSPLSMPPVRRKSISEITSRMRRLRIHSSKLSSLPVA